MNFQLFRLLYKQKSQWKVEIFNGQIDFKNSQNRTTAKQIKIFEIILTVDFLFNFYLKISVIDPPNQLTIKNLAVWQLTSCLDIMLTNISQSYSVNCLVECIKLIKFGHTICQSQTSQLIFLSCTTIIQFHIIALFNQFLHEHR